MIDRLNRTIRSLHEDSKGSVVIETAFVAPLLVLMAVGSFEVSSMVARQHELQNGAAEATAVALAANMGAETNTQYLETMLERSLHLTEDQVTVTKMYRCDSNTTLVSNADTCKSKLDDSGGGNDAVISSYVRINITDSYTPVWSKIGMARKVKYTVTRTIQLS